MIECCKLIFDLALYYTLSGFYLMLLAHTGSSPAGFAALALVTAADALIRKKAASEDKVKYLRYAFLMLPLLTLLFRPGLWPLLQLLPAWAYLAWSILTGRLYTEYQDFRLHFGFGLKLLLLLLPGLLFGRQMDALRAAIPYLTLMLACGVCLLRMLREHRPGGLRQGVYMAVFLLLAVLLTAGQVPQLLLQGVGLVYNYLIAPLLLVLAMVISTIFFVFYSAFRWVIGLFPRAETAAPLPPLGFGEDLIPEEALQQYTSQPVWLRVLFPVLIGLAVALLLFFIFRRLAGSGLRTRSAVPAQEREALPGVQPDRRRGPGLIRPREPRLAVRYYYAKFLAECRRRGRGTYTGMTSRELSRVTARLFPGADPEALAALYRPARYCLRSPVTPEEAAGAAAAWKELKKTKDPERI